MTSFANTTIQRIFSQGHERTLRAKRNIAASFVIKVINIAVGLVLVPLTIHYLDPTRYGIWITLTSIIGWFSFFDIGLGNGLRNRLAESFAKDDFEKARVYVSTTYITLIFIIGAILSLFYILNPFMNWVKVLNAGNAITLRDELAVVALVVFTFFSLKFVFKLIETILIADQRPAKASLFEFIARIVSLILIYILTLTTKGSLLYLALVISGTPVAVLIFASFYFFSGKYMALRPSIKLFDPRKVKDLLELGLQFFVIQIAAILLYQTNNIIIAHLFGPEKVTPYAIAFRYFNVLIMVFSIIMSPFWSAFTEAWAKKEIRWIKNIIRNLLKLWILLFFSGVLLLVCSKWAYAIWVGPEIQIPYTMSALVVCWVLLNAWNMIFGQFLNGVGKIRIQVIVAILSALGNVPLAVFLGKRFGIEGVLIANIAVLLVSFWLYPIQYRKIVNKKAKGIWNR